MYWVTAIWPSTCRFGHPLIQSVGQLIAKSAVSVLVNLALVFAVGIPIGLATRDKGYAALIGLVTFIVFINAMNVTLQLQGELALRNR